MKQNKQIKFNLKTIIIMVCIIIIIIGIIAIIKYVNKTITTIKLEDNNSSIEFFTLKTHSGFNETIKNTQYKITNEDELSMFNTLYTGFKLSKNYNLSNNTIFIKVMQVSSGGINIDFKKVSIKNKVKFKFNEDIEGATCDMTYWYLIAIIPNTKLKKVDVKDWESPIDVNNNFLHK